jgi:hypothetical protein
MPRTKLYKATIKTEDPEKANDQKTRDIYVTEETMIKATNKLCSELEPDEELQHMNLVSDECYV